VQICALLLFSATDDLAELELADDVFEREGQFG
jgi:hypothetical protein